MGKAWKAWLLVLVGVGGFWHCEGLQAQGRLVAEELTHVSTSSHGAVEISQPELLPAAMRQDLLVNRGGLQLSGYRVRVYRGLGRDARARSIAIADKLKAQHPGMAIYRAYQAPYYLTSVGNCRTRIEALSLQHRLLASYPQAFVIEENIDYPPLCVQMVGSDEGLTEQKSDGGNNE